MQKWATAPRGVKMGSSRHRTLAHEKGLPPRLMAWKRAAATTPRDAKMGVHRCALERENGMPPPQLGAWKWAATTMPWGTETGHCHTTGCRNKALCHARMDGASIMQALAPPHLWHAHACSTVRTCTHTCTLLPPPFFSSLPTDKGLWPLEYRTQEKVFAHCK